LVERRGTGHVAAGGQHLRLAGEREHVAVDPLQRVLVRALGRDQVVLREVQVSELHLAPRGPFGARRAGLDRTTHGVDRAVKVAVELAEVGHARVRGEIRAEIDHPLCRIRRLAVAAELDIRVHEDAVDSGPSGRRGLRDETPMQGGGEIVARERQTARHDGDVGVERRELAGSLEQRGCLRVQRRVVRLAHAHEIRRGERGHQPRIVGCARELALCVRDRPLAIGPGIEEPLEGGGHVDDVRASRGEHSTECTGACRKREEPQRDAPHGSGT